MKSIAVAATALSLGSTVYAAISKQCPTSDVCYSLSIPKTTANTGSGDIYFQISAPTSYQWVALGQGSSMSGSNIFVMYTSSDGKNVTVSPRLGTGHTEPEHDTSAKITLLDGSGVSGGNMIANVKCSNCDSWSSGSMDFSSSSASWIYAVKEGSSLDSDSLSESISQHDSEGSFNWQFSSAKGGSDVNPFVAASGSTSGSSGSSSQGSGSGSGSGSSGSSIPSTCTPIAGYASDASGSTASATTGTAGAATITDGPNGTGCPTSLPTPFPTGSPPAWVQSCYGSLHHGGHGAHPTGAPYKEKRADDSCPAGYASTSDSTGTFSDNGFSGLPYSKQQQLILAHAVLACLAFVGLFPIGGIIIRLANFTGLIWIHAALQLVSYLIYIVAFGIGIYMATNLGYMSRAHPIIGIALFFILLGQPIFGFLHHKMFKKYGSRSIWSYVHLYHGRIAILLGMVNGGLGIQLADTASMGAKVAYAVITAIMALIYIAAIIMGELRRKRNQKTVPRGTYDHESKHSRNAASSGGSSAADTENQTFYGKSDSRDNDPPSYPTGRVESGMIFGTGPSAARR